LASISEMDNISLLGINKVSGIEPKIRQVPEYQTPQKSPSPALPGDGEPYCTLEGLGGLFLAALGSAILFLVAWQTLKTSSIELPGPLWLTGQLIGQTACGFQASTCMADKNMPSCIDARMCIGIGLVGLHTNKELISRLQRGTLWRRPFGIAREKLLTQWLKSAHCVRQGKRHRRWPVMLRKWLDSSHIQKTRHSFSYRVFFIFKNTWISARSSKTLEQQIEYLFDYPIPFLWHHHVFVNVWCKRFDGILYIIPRIKSYYCECHFCANFVGKRCEASSATNPISELHRAHEATITQTPSQAEHRF